MYTLSVNHLKGPSSQMAQLQNGFTRLHNISPQPCTTLDKWYMQTEIY